MILLVVICITCIPMLLYGRRYYNSLFNPIHIFVGINFLSLICSFLYVESITYSFEIGIVIELMFISFFVGLLISRFSLIFAKHGYSYQYRAVDSYSLCRIILYASIIYNAALIFYLRNMFSNYGISEFFLNMGEVNAYVQSDDFKGGIFNYIVPLGVPLSLCILYYAKKNKWNLFLFIQYILCFAHCISPRRAELFNFIVITLIYLMCCGDYFQSSRNKLKVYIAVLIFAIFLVGIMSYTQELLGKSSDEGIEILGFTLPSYLTSPFIYFALNYPYLEAIDFDSLVEPSIFMGATFRLLYMLLNMFGASIDVTTDFALDFKEVGQGMFNTAPLLYYSFKDLGYFFFLDFVMLGFISHKSYLWIKSQSILHRSVGCIFFCLLLFSFRGYLIIYLAFALSIFYSIVLQVLIKKIK